MDIRDIVDTFSDENCPKLRNCPKLFFFTCCRNSLETSEPRAEGRTLARPFVAETTAHTDRTNFPVMQSLNQQWVDSNRDTFICYSCAEGRKTFYDDDYGITYFGQALSHSIAQYACEESLSSIMSRTCDLLKFFIKHTGFNPPEFRGKGLRRQLCFNP
ncbi:unnamed protein product [Medioppia subpectinata]|uniref:Caspase family p20 domain-containing protein n=1 Tax=Medioppia subpectinata TaxID=1979941 RepID=A0A7R9KRF3_9ACAR|nr:unnamed protein product [Medioppia subpectinata]CAG2107067.1 unnamed protein product [Medioppia subpectinata]